MMAAVARRAWPAGMALALGGALILGSGAGARDFQGEYKARGLGGDTCVSFLAVPPEQRSLYYSWIAGYLTAYNYLVPDTYSVAEYTGLTRTNDWFEDYCGKHPADLLHQAMRRFLAERHRVRLKSKPDPAALTQSRNER